MSGFDKLTLVDEAVVIGIVLEGFLYGFYSAIFWMYIQYQASKVGIDKRNVLLYALCILYILSTAMVVLDVTRTILNSIPTLSPKSLPYITYVSFTIIGLCDFIPQAILIYRCWVVWGHSIRVIIIPSILALASFATWLAITSFKYTTLGPMFLISLAISLTVNVIVTGLIVLRILKVYREVRPSLDQTSGGGRDSPKLRSIIFIIIESGMALFSIQLIRAGLTIPNLDALKIIIFIDQMFNGITPTIILLRVSMRLSFYDEKSMEEAVGSLRFGSCNDDADIDIVDQERLDRIGKQGNDIEIGVDK